MQEIELKFLVPAARLKGLMRQAKVKSSETSQLAAHYYDTADYTLANAGIGLRIRKEGSNWVQTIKAGGDGLAARLEHNTLLDANQVQAMLDDNNLLPDLSLYQDTPIAPALAEFKLKKLTKNLTRQYVTDVQRTTRLLNDTSNNDSDKSRGNDSNALPNRVEMAYDYGQIIHGNDASSCQPIQEIEFELVSGELEFLFATAKIWCKRYKLCLSTVTKAERGGLLIKGEDHSPAVSADLSQLKVDEHSSLPQFIRAVVHNCLLQILPNSSAIVAGSEDDSHLLQLRLGIRRLRVALKAFKKFSEHINPEWSLILRQTEHLLSHYRGLAYIAAHVEPQLVQQGAPNVQWTADIAKLKITPINAIAANDFQITLLELIEFAMSADSDEDSAAPLAVAKLAKILAKKQLKLLKADHQLVDLSDGLTDDLSADLSEKPSEPALQDTEVDSEAVVASHMTGVEKQQAAQQEVQRQLSDLRYITEFAAPLYASKKTKRFLKQLTKAQQALSQHQDHQQYQRYYQQKSTTDVNALYGVGWFAALTLSDWQRCQKRLAKVRRTATFW